MKSVDTRLHLRTDHENSTPLQLRCLFPEPAGMEGRLPEPVEAVRRRERNTLANFKQTVIE